MIADEDDSAWSGTRSAYSLSFGNALYLHFIATQALDMWSTMDLFTTDDKNKNNNNIHLGI